MIKFNWDFTKFAFSTILITLSIKLPFLQHKTIFSAILISLIGIYIQLHQSENMLSYTEKLQHCQQHPQSFPVALKYS